MEERLAMILIARLHERETPEPEGRKWQKMGGALDTPRLSRVQIKCLNFRSFSKNQMRKEAKEKKSEKKLLSLHHLALAFLSNSLSLSLFCRNAGASTFAISSRATRSFSYTRISAQDGRSPQHDDEPYL